MCVCVCLCECVLVCVRVCVCVCYLVYVVSSIAESWILYEAVEFIQISVADSAPLRKHVYRSL